MAGSTIGGNTATSSDYTEYGLGGGIYNYGQLEITNSTIVTNTAMSAPDPQGQRQGNGGGIENDGTAVVITNSTVAYNYAFFGGGGVETLAGQVQVESTIIAENFAPAHQDVSGSFTSAGFNLIGATDNNGFTTTADLTGTAASLLNPKLDNQLADNGGPTRTVALLCNSPAIDRGTSNGLTGAPTTDQRGTGFSRTVNDSSIPNPDDGTDIGAFEYGAGITASSAVSRKYHGASSPAPHFEIPLPPSCNSTGIESRRNTGADTTGPNVGHDHEIVVTFPSKATVGSAYVVDVNVGNDAGTATFSVSGNVVTVDLHGFRSI